MQELRKLARFLTPYWRWAVLAPILMVLEVAMDLMQPRLVQQIVDQGITKGDMQLVLQTGTWMIGFAVIGLLGGMGCTLYAVLAAQGFGSDLRHSLFAKVQEFSFGNIDRQGTGTLITRLTNDVTQVQEVVMILLRVMVRVPLLLVGSLIMAIITCPQLAFLFALLIPVVLVALIGIIYRTYPMFGEVQKRLDALNTVLQENLAGVRVVKAFARAKHEITRFHKSNDRLMDQNITTIRLSAVTMPFVMLALNLGVVATIWIGGNKVHAGVMHVGQVIAFLNYLMQTLMSLMMVSMLILRVSRGEASALRIAEVLSSEPQVLAPVNGTHPTTWQGRVAFENVSFRYNDSDADPVLKELSFVAEPGQTVAILGATGSGKSSLVNLIPRFYDVTEGKVTIDGIDVRMIDEAALHQAVGIALQESILFSGTVRDNIRYGRPEASEEEVITAAQVAQADDFIQRLPEGYGATVEQRGVNLSGGQKQRIAIARALLPKPAVLILDDSTSAVDVRTEARIQKALEENYQGQTRILVAQRISAVLQADRILVLEDGRIVAEGTHTELLSNSPIYREIYDSQVESGVIAHGGE